MIGLPIRNSDYRWWEHVVDQDGNPVNLLTYKDLENMWCEEYDEIINEAAKEMSKRLAETIEKMGKEFLL